MVDVSASIDLVASTSLTVDGVAESFGENAFIASTSLIIDGVSARLGTASLVATSTLTIDSEVWTTLSGIPGEVNAVQIFFELSGIMDPVFPPPTPPVDFAGLVDPTVAPVLTKSDTVNGHLLVGTYRYSYAAWKGTPVQATAPSPTSDITLTIEDTVTLTYPTIAGADGYLVYREGL